MTNKKHGGSFYLDGTHETETVGDTVRARDRIKKLNKVEKYLIKRCQELKIKFAYDCMASETSNWDTLNYTNYCGMVFISSLSYDSIVYQLYDALIDNKEPVGHIDFIRNNLENHVGSKYVLNSKRYENEEFNIYDKEASFDAVCILPGTNKFGLLCHTKVKTIAKHFGNNIIFKLHPLSNKDQLEESGFFRILEQYGCQCADITDDMYDLIKKSKYVYTTHVSETALTSLILNKTIEPIDKYSDRMISGLSALNHFCYNYEDAVNKLDKIFASPISGIIHPDIDKNWKNKIDKYLDYILNKRKNQDGFYLRN